MKSESGLGWTYKALGGTCSSFLINDACLLSFLLFPIKYELAICRVTCDHVLFDQFVCDHHANKNPVKPWFIKDQVIIYLRNWLPLAIECTLLDTNKSLKTIYP